MTPITEQDLRELLELAKHAPVKVSLFANISSPNEVREGMTQKGRQLYDQSRNLLPDLVREYMEMVELLERIVPIGPDGKRYYQVSWNLVNEAEQRIAAYRGKS